MSIKTVVIIEIILAIIRRVIIIIISIEITMIMIIIIAHVRQPVAS